MADHAANGWIGARLLRKEDARHLIGAGMFVADIRMPGLQDVAFVRSQMAHAHVRGVIEARGLAARVHARRSRPLKSPGRAGALRRSASPLSAARVGQGALCRPGDRGLRAPTRAQAEDLADRVAVELEELPAVVDCVAAMQPGQPARVRGVGGQRLHREHGDGGRHRASLASRADPACAAQFRMNRQARSRSKAAACSPIGTIGSTSWWSTPRRRARTSCASASPQALGIPEHQLRVIAPDVGGGFGGKNRLMPEEIAVAALALKLGHPVRWIEDRREHLLASVHARDHIYELTVYADTRRARCSGIDGESIVDAGAYALWPTGAFMEAEHGGAQPARALRHPAPAGRTRYTVATNKAPIGPYRGVARPGACFAIERTVDEVARELGREPVEVRRQNMVTAARAALHAPSPA